MSHLRRGGIWKIGRKGWKCTFGFENFLVPGVWIRAGAAAGVGAGAGAGEPAGKVQPASFHQESYEGKSFLTRLSWT